MTSFSLPSLPEQFGPLLLFFEDFRAVQSRARHAESSHAMAVKSSALGGRETHTSEKRLHADYRSDDGFLHLHVEKSDE